MASGGSGRGSAREEWTLALTIFLVLCDFLGELSLFSISILS